MVEKRNLWVGLRPLDTEHVASLRSQLASVLPPSFTSEPDPHITFLQCNYPQQNIDELRTQARKLGLIGREFYVTGLRCYPDARDPKYIMLDLDFDIGNSRDELTDFIESHNGEVLGSPAPPHITLWKNQPHTKIGEDTSMALAERMADLRTDAQWRDQIGDLEVSTF